MPKNKRVVIIGGGTGTFVALTGLKKYPIHLSAIITMMDSGGSTGRLRDQLGVLPPGDLRQALVALSRSEKIWRDLFVYRFDNGDLGGHNFGNIFLSTLEKMTGSLKKALDLAAQILDVEGEVIPVTFDQSDLCVKLADGRVISGETHIDESDKVEKRARIVKAFLKPPARPNPKALKAIAAADLIVFGPGDLYTSIIPNLLVTGIAAALAKSRAKTVFVMNLMTKCGQTTAYTAAAHLQDLESYLLKPIDTILVNRKKPSQKALNWYAEFQESIVENDLPASGKNKTMVAALLDEAIFDRKSGDKIRRSIIRHQPQKLAQALVTLLKKT